MKSKSLITFFCALGFAGLVLGVMSGERNSFWECCDTRAWGWPCPWRVEGGCGAAPSGKASMIVNLAFALGFAACVSWLFRPRRQRARVKPPTLGIGRVLRR